MPPEDERLVADLDQATSQLRASLRSCRRILDTYRPKLAPAAVEPRAERSPEPGVEPPLFGWPGGGAEPPPRERE